STAMRKTRGVRQPRAMVVDSAKRSQERSRRSRAQIDTRSPKDQSTITSSTNPGTATTPPPLEEPADKREVPQDVAEILGHPEGEEHVVDAVVGDQKRPEECGEGPGRRHLFRHRIAIQ